jgi:hypothetical protein
MQRGDSNLAILKESTYDKRSVSAFAPIMLPCFQSEARSNDPFETSASAAARFPEAKRSKTLTRESMVVYAQGNRRPYQITTSAFWLEALDRLLCLGYRRARPR